jgi:hypothetical protein
MIASVALASISGCCAFMPCHPAVSVSGRVTTTSGEPISGAAITLHGMSGIADANGCFILHGPDALPFEIHFDAQGFKPVRTDVKAGSYQAQAVMAPTSTGDESKIQLSKSRSFAAGPVPGCA